MLIYAACLPIWALTVSPILTVLIYYFRMHGGFADPEFFGGGPYRRPVLYQVKSQFLGPLLQILFDSAPLLQAVPLYEPERGKRTENQAVWQGIRITE